jgi:hypothetical protein
MHAPTLPSTYENSVASSHRSSASEFFTTHPILPILRGLFLSSLLWIALAFVLYGVYTLVAGPH